MKNLEELFDTKDYRITEETVEIEKYVNKNWPSFYTKKEVPLKNLFKRPENVGLSHIWKHGSADLVVYKNNNIVCIIEPGGSHHFTDKKQITNDKRKWKLCEINGVRCLKMSNDVREGLSKRKWRRLVGRYLFGITKI